MNIMERFIILAATTFREQVNAATHGTRVSSRDVLTALTVGLVVGFLIVIWVYFRFRKKRQHEDRERMGRKIVAPAPSTDSESGERRRIRKRRRRRDHRPRNPSLHQTGGLPPQRSDDDLPKF